MVVEQKLNRIKALNRVSKNINILMKTKRTIKDIFEISFSRENFILFNITKWNTLTEISYGEAKKRIKDFANHFAKTISKNEKYVGLLIENCPEWIYTYYGLLMSGFVPVLLSTAASDNENKDILNDLGSKTVVSNRNIADTLINPFEIGSYDEEVKENWANAMIFITSGTSGKSKILLYTGEELCQQIVNAGCIVKDYPLISSTYKGYLKHLLVLPLFHVFGFIAVFLWFSFFNTTFVIPSDLTGDKIREACLIAEPTHIFAVPLFWDTVTKKITRVVKQKKATEKFEKAIKFSVNLQQNLGNLGNSIVKGMFGNYLENIFGKSIKFCVTGGSYVSKETLRIINGLGYPLMNGYGSTEVGISSLTKCKPIKTRLDFSIGVPFENFEYAIADNNELLIKGNCVYNSMLKEGIWIKRDVSGFVYSNDSVNKVKKNIYINGRLDEYVIGENGENYSLPKIENSITSKYADDVACIADNKKISLIISYSKVIDKVLILQDVNQIMESEAFRKSNISNVLVTYDPIPKANGIKIKRNMLLTMIENKQINVIELSSLENETSDISLDDKLLSEIIEKMGKFVDKSEIAKTSDFFIELGGDSLSYYELLTDISSNYLIDINLIKQCRNAEQFVLAIMRNTK